MNNIISVKNISKTLSNVRPVSDVTFNVAAGEFLTIQGPSGSGKTTLLGLLAGLDKPDEGRIIVGGQDITRMTEDELALFRRHNIGFVFQSFNLISTLNVIENVAFPLFPEHISRKDMTERAKKAIDLVGLGDRLKHRPGELSGGEQQRVAIARSLINNPGIILADEPTGNLDTQNGEKVIKLLQELQKGKGLTLVLVTHDDKIAAKSDRIVKLVDGRIVNEE